MTCQFCKKSTSSLDSFVYDDIGNFICSGCCEKIEFEFKMYSLHRSLSIDKYDPDAKDRFKKYVIEKLRDNKIDGILS
jgi:hypothetical protein